MTKEESGYTIPPRDALNLVKKLPTNETKCLPFHNEALDKVARRIELNNATKEINALRLIIININSPRFRKKSPRTIINTLYDILRAISHFNEIEKAYRFKNDRGIFEVDLKDWLIQCNFSESSIGATLNTLVQMVKEACILPNTDHLKNEAVYHICLNSRFFSEERDPTQTLDTLHPELALEATDKDLLIGLREAMVWFLNKMTDTRQKLLANLSEDLRQYLVNLSGNKESSTSKDRHFAKFTAGRSGQPHDGLMRDMVEILTSLNCSCINEIMFCNMNLRKPFSDIYIDNPSFLSSRELSDYFSDLAVSRVPAHRFGRDDLLPFGHPQPALKNGYCGNISRIKTHYRTDAFFPSLSFLVYPSIDESLAMEWLLASERIQLTGIENLNIRRNVLWDKEKGTLQFKNVVKHRRKGEQHSAIYQNDAMYRVYSDWIQLLETAESYIDNLDGSIIPPFIDTVRMTRGKRPFHRYRVGFWLMALEGTHTQNALLSDLQGSKNFPHVKSFLKLLHAHLSQTRMNCCEDHLNRKNRNDSSNSTKDKPKANASKRSLGIGVKVIAQTRAVLEHKIETGRLVGHNEKTHEEIYINRTRSRHINAQSASFAADVGNVMFAEAQKLADKAELVSVSQIQDILDMESISPSTSEYTSMQGIVEEAEKKGFLASITTVLSKNDQTYVVISPWSAALIQGYVDHIENQKQRLEYCHTQKRNDLLLKKAYLSLLLERFPHKVRNEGKTILDSWDIPYPSLV